MWDLTEPAFNGFSFYAASSGGVFSVYASPFSAGGVFYRLACETLLFLMELMKGFVEFAG
jgi:hypothetical protein